MDSPGLQPDSTTAFTICRFAEPTRPLISFIFLKFWFWRAGFTAALQHCTVKLIPISTHIFQPLPDQFGSVQQLEACVCVCGWLSKPAFLKRFRVGQKLAISAEVSHCSGQLCGPSRPPLSCRGNTGLRHVHISFRRCPLTSGAFVAEVGFLSFRCSGAVRTSAVRMEAAINQPAYVPPAKWTV